MYGEYLDEMVCYDMSVKKIKEFKELKKYIDISVLEFKQNNFNDFMYYIKIIKIIEHNCNQHALITFKQFIKKKYIY